MGQIQVAYDLDGIAGLCVIEPAVHSDARGYFMETFSQKDMYEAGLYYSFVQDNQSMSVKGVLRGLHFQKRFPQAKLMRVIRGAVYDVAVGLRTAFWCFRMKRKSATNAMISIMPKMRAASCGTIRKSALSGPE